MQSLFVVLLSYWIGHSIAANTTTGPVIKTDDTDSKACDYKKGEFQFVYTECNKKDDRWKVAIPNRDTCSRLKNTPSAVQGLKCSFSCSPGEYVNLATQTCEKCSAGSYSIGDGKRFVEWKTLPEGFSTRGQKPEGSHSPGSRAEKEDCKNAGWRMDKFSNYIQSAGTSCKSILMYDVNLKKAGNISFTVSGNDEQAFFHVWVQGSTYCRKTEYSKSLEENNMERYYSGLNSSWTTHTLNMEKGHNTVFFEASFFPHNMGEHAEHAEEEADDFNPDRSVMIKEIVARGFSYAEKCDPCEPGTYSGVGYASCKQCPENTYSSGSSGNCIKCTDKFYASPGSRRCMKRMLCYTADYHMDWEACKDGKTRQRFAWNEPHQCTPTSANPLPPLGPSVDCPACNPGETHNLTAAGCSFCPPGTFNEIGKGACQKCPPATEDAPGLFYKNWKVMPTQPMRLFCLAKPDSGCRSKQGWELADSYLSSGLGHADDARLVLYLLIPGFTKDTAELTIDFAIHCPTDQCRSLFQSITKGSVHRIKQFNGGVDRTVWKYRHHGRSPIRFRFIFEKEYDDEKQTFKFKDSYAKIYSLELTNVKHGGTRKCESCVVNEDRGCISCEKGEYLNTNTSTCAKCPAGTYIDDLKDATKGISACKKCIYGTVSDAGSSVCYSDCRYKFLNGDAYDFTALKGFHLVKGNNLFTTKGYPYYHIYNISLCGGVSVQCVDNTSTPQITNDFPMITGAVCRSTMIPDSNRIITAQSISLGDAVHDISSHSEFVNEGNDTTNDGDVASRTAQLQFRMYSKRKTDVCPDGTNSTIRLVCNPDAVGISNLESGNKECKSETCDGCTYPFTWYTALACPVCTVNDYLNITTACKNGKKKIHYIWKLPHVCHGGSMKPKDEKRTCSIFEKSIMDMKAVILVFIGFAIVLALVVLFLCYRNRRLSYKYSRLIDGQSMGDGELPPVDQCALEEGEEDEQEEYVTAKGKSGKGRIIDRLKGLAKTKKRGAFSEFETINLDSMKDYTDDDEDEI